MSEDRDTGAMSPGPEPASLYIHVPFCSAKCTYCDFHSAPIPADPGIAEHFVWAVAEGAAHWASLGALDDVVSIYIGGGTPTTLGESLATLLERVSASARLRPEAEITVECNPDSVEPRLVDRLMGAGVTRFSLGVQSFDDTVLSTLGRCHDSASAERAAALLYRSGAQLSLDLMCGVSGQSLDSWRRTVEHALGTGAGHVSVYPLSVEPGTPLAARVEEGTSSVPDMDLAAEMMEVSAEMLEAGGLLRYEVASYAREGERSVHNSGYWTGRPYLGIGPSAASMMTAEWFAAAVACKAWTDPGVTGVGRTVEQVPEDAARVRFTRLADTVAFLRKPVGPPEEVEYLTGAQAAAEDAMLGLRLAEGISAELAAAADAEEILSQLADRGLVERVSDRWRISRAGWLLGNEVFSAVWNAGARRGLA